MSVTYHGETWEIGDVLVPIKGPTKRGCDRLQLLEHAQSKGRVVQQTGLRCFGGFVLLREINGEWAGLISQECPSLLTKLKPNTPDPIEADTEENWDKVLEFIGPII